MLYEKLIRDLKDNPTTIIDLAKKYKISRSQVKKSLTELRKQGIFIDKIKTDEATKYFIPLRLPKQEEYKTEINHFALMGDTHLGSRYAEQECLNDFYDKVDEAGIHHVIHAGDLVEGTTVYRGQINDLEPDCVSLEGQIEKAIKEYPRKKDVQTIIISGNHDLRQFERQGVDPVKMVASKRRDFKFIGQWYGRVRLEDDVLLEVTHASGNSPYCYDDKTEILTDEGWKLFKDLNKHEKVATLNIKTLKFEWKKPVDYIEQEYNGKMISIQTRFIDLVVIPKHKLVVRNSPSYINMSNRKNKNKREYRRSLDSSWRLIDAKELKEQYVRQKWQMLRTSFNWEGKEADINWIKLLAWYISEGFSRKGKIVISQTKQENMKEIQKIVENLGFKYSMYRNNTRLNIFSTTLAEKISNLCGRTSYEKHIPKFIKELNIKQLKEFIVTLCKGDGWFDKNNQPVGYTSVSKRLIDDLTEILLKVGWYGKVSKRIINTKFGVFEGYTCTITQKQVMPQVTHKPEEIEYHGKIYSVEVPNDILFVRRNYKAVWSGNTKGYKFRTYLRERPINSYPDILAMGHLHSALFEDVQGTLSYLVGCFMGDTDYTRKKGLTPSVGGWLVELDIDKTIKRVKNEFVRY